MLQATAPMAPSIGYDWLVDGFSLLRGGRKIDFSSCGPSKNRVLDGIVIDASAQGMVGMTSLGWQSVTLSTKGLGGRHGWGAGRHYVPTSRLRHAQKSSWNLDAMEHIKHVELSRKCFSDYGSWSMTTSKRAKV